MKQLPFGPYKIQHSGIHDIIHQCGCISEIPRIFFWIHEPRKCHQQQNTWWKLDNADQYSTATAFSQSTTEAFCHPGAPSRIWIGRGACLGRHKVICPFGCPGWSKVSWLRLLQMRRSPMHFAWPEKKTPTTNWSINDQLPPNHKALWLALIYLIFLSRIIGGVAHNPMNSWGAAFQKSRSNGEWAPKEGVVQLG